MAGKPTTHPLTPDEERAWRSLIRLMITMPRAIDEDLIRRGGISLTRYVVLMRLSEAPGQALRMSELAEAVAISPSRMTRVIQSMAGEGLVTRQPIREDGRASLAVLTKKGLRCLQEVWPAHLAGVRALVMDHINAADLADLTRMTHRLLQAIEHSEGSQRDTPFPAESRQADTAGAA